MEQDPTKVDIHNDPTTARFRGIAIHGNTPFDVPYISEVDTNLWQGGCESGLVLPRFVKHLVSLYPWEEYKVFHVLDSKVVVKQYDSLKGPDKEQLVALANWINLCRKSAPVLVHCQAGLNRSGLLVGLALVLNGHTPEDALRQMREKRSPAVLCNPTFERFLLDWNE